LRPQACDGKAIRAPTFGVRLTGLDIGLKALDSVSRMLRTFLSNRPRLFGFLCGLAYGLFVQVVARTGLMQSVVLVMTFGFVFLLPFSLGFVTAYFSKSKGAAAYFWGPQLSILSCLAIAIVVGWEGLICLILAVPVYCAMGALGGFAAWVTRKYSRRGSTVACLVMLMPPSSAALESFIPVPTTMHHVHTQIDIDASTEIIWDKIVRVRAIDEPLTGVFYRMGFPKPVEAVITHDGIGGVRHARFEHDLVFIETVDAWEEGKRFSFRIDVDPDHTPLTTLDPHVTVGGEYFDVLRGTYWLEPKPGEAVALHLESEFRLSTAFNAYAGIWGDFLMRDIQNSILRVIAHRAEHP
jgi:hypothetical protein